MLKVFLHNGPPSTVTRYNELGRLDIGYAALDIHADYKVILSMAGVGELPHVLLRHYPRWTASVWDLVMRAIATSLYGEEVFPELGLARRGAFAQNLTAFVEHWPDGLEYGRSTIATAHIRMQRRRCRYVATFTDDILEEQVSPEFAHTPEGLMPWDLLARAYAWATHGHGAMPVRPALYMPIPVEQAGQVLVALETVKEPARTGLHRWMFSKGIQPLEVGALTSVCVKESDYVNFLRRAV